MASRSTADLIPELQKLCQAHLAAANKRLAPMNASVFLTCTYRSREEQAELYSRGRTAPGRKVTNAKPGQSLHNATDSKGKPAARAYDVAVLESGKLNWNADSLLWQIVGEEGEKLGLSWAWRWKSFKEAPHFQLSSSSGS